MSYLIEDYSFQACLYQLIHLKTTQNSLTNRNHVNQQFDLEPFSRCKRVTQFNNVKSIFPLNEICLHKNGTFSLLLLKKIQNNKHYQFQGIVLEKDQKFTIKLKQKRIYFGKQWMKQKRQSQTKVLIDLSNGQIRLCWPQILNCHKSSILNPKLSQKKLFQTIFTEMRNFFEQFFIPTCRRILLSYTQKLFESENKYQQRFRSQYQQRQHYQYQQSKKSSQQNVQKLQKYLNMSSTIDTFQKDKQTYKKLQDRISKQKESIMRIQKSIDISFSKIGSQVSLYASHTISKAKKTLSQLGNLSNQQQKAIEEYVWKQSSKNTLQNQYQYIYNCIGILKVQNKKRFISSGGTSSIYMAKMMFQYIYSDDSKFWIEQNKRSPQNALQKCFVIKEPKKGFQNKLKHQNMIVRQMKGGYSIYLSKYYRVQNIEKDSTSMKTEDLVIMDFLKGDTLDKYQRINKQCLSFWTKIYLLRNLVNGLRFISNYKIVHLDLKPNNIIVISDLMTKIIDFSESYHSQICEKDYLPGLSLPYSAPETLLKNYIEYNEKCDVFSLGVIIFQLFIGQPLMQLPKDKLFQIYQSKQYLNKIYFCPQLTLDQNISPIINVIINLCMKCLDPRPDYRPTLNWISIIVNQILEFFKST